ncbi:cation:proton antiporter [Pontibacter sp. SGAir0037]|uniref:cation:proton antiporter domain-containing protein n=1 Tax=Pontibacter sp. SGAir0037 TaxID=2571030 RepID=UPI0010CD4E73|nr:cation:proton antiporter [Pontibacter sp. SGAir0037]QCR22564.1 cation/H(+) antiporter [Pontibacter sp. SGAir0037]
MQAVAVKPPKKRGIRNTLFYVLVIGFFSVLMYWIVLQGSALEAAKGAAAAGAAEASTWEQFQDTLSHNLKHPLAILLVQIIVIILTARFFGFLFSKIGQPTVIGEIVAGIFLGPSLLGWLFPVFSQALFPEQSLGNLQFLSQIGLILFMFVVGMELDLKVLRTKAHDALVISHASIIIPFALGTGLAYFIYVSYAPAHIDFLSFTLFIGIAMSITAFPVLARIVQERGISKTRLGTVVITCAAADDITAWCILAAVIAIVKAGSFESSIYTIALAVSYVFLMLKLVQPFLKRLGNIYSNRETLGKPIVAVFFLVLLLSAYATEVIGIHALFGAFMAGVMMPDNIRFRNIFIEKIEDIALVLLLPLFFVFTGLRTQIGLLNSSELWLTCGLIILVATTGKLAGSALAARFMGQSWRESLIIGSLMNTRGLMELVVLNIGYDLGVLSPEIFAMMVIMALVTTFLTGPALDLINKVLPAAKPLSPFSEQVTVKGKFNILLSFGNPESGRVMLQLAHSLTRRATDNATITALHLSPSEEVHLFEEREMERISFSPVLSEAERLNIAVSTLFKPSQDISKEIIDTANRGDFDLMLIGMGQSVFQNTLLGKILGVSTRIINPEKLLETLTGREKLFAEAVLDDRVRQITKATKIPVGILIEKKLKKIDAVFIPVFSRKDIFLLQYAQKLIKNNDSGVVILDAMGEIEQSIDFKEAIRAIELVAPGNIALYNDKNIHRQFLYQQDLMLISLSSWKQLVRTQSNWLRYAPSVLILKS